jgi:hypothetical protein
VDTRTVVCPQCGTLAVVATCRRCGREFALTVAHRDGRPRTYDDGPLDPSGDVPDISRCDFCDARARGETLAAVRAGLRQSTCPGCHTGLVPA